MFKRVLAGLAVVLGSIPGAAVATSTDNATTGGSAELPIAYITVGNTAYTQFDLITGDPEVFFGDDNACIGKIATAHTSHERMLRTLQAAQLSNRRVMVFYQKIGTDCWVKHVTMETVN